MPFPDYGMPASDGRSLDDGIASPEGTYAPYDGGLAADDAAAPLADGSAERPAAPSEESPEHAGMPGRTSDAALPEGSGPARMRHAAANDAERSPQDISALFSMAFAGGAPAAEAPAPAAPEAAAAPEGLDRAELEAMVSRILVSAPDSGRQEVRLSLAEGALPGTDIILERSPDGLLTVTIVSSDENSFQTAVAARGDLQQILEDQQGREVRVVAERSDASRSGGTGAEDGGTDRRSRGFRGTAPDDDENL